MGAGVQSGTEAFGHTLRACIACHPDDALIKLDVAQLAAVLGGAGDYVWAAAPPGLRALAQRQYYLLLQRFPHQPF